MCFFEVGDGKGTLLQFDYDHPPKPPKPNTIWHLGKIVFNKTYWRHGAAGPHLAVVGATRAPRPAGARPAYNRDVNRLHRRARSRERPRLPPVLRPGPARRRRPRTGPPSSMPTVASTSTPPVGRSSSTSAMAGSEIAEAVADQLGRLAYAHGSAFTTEALERYAAEVGEHLPVDEPYLYPVSGGSEAIESALKLARGDAAGPRRGRPRAGLRALGQLPRQHARARWTCPGASRCAGRTRAGWAASVTCPRRTRTAGGLPGSRALAHGRRARGRAGRGDPRGGPADRRRVRRRADRGRHAGRRRAARTATGRRSPRSAGGTACC